MHKGPPSLAGALLSVRESSFGTESPFSVHAGAAPPHRDLLPAWICSWHRGPPLDLEIFLSVQGRSLGKAGLLTVLGPTAGTKGLLYVKGFPHEREKKEMERKRERGPPLGTYGLQSVCAEASSPQGGSPVCTVGLLTLGLFGSFFSVARPPLLWSWEGSNYPSRSSNGPTDRKDLNYTKTNKVSLRFVIRILLSHMEPIPILVTGDCHW